MRIGGWRASLLFLLFMLMDVFGLVNGSLECTARKAIGSMKTCDILLGYNVPFNAGHRIRNTISFLLVWWYVLFDYSHHAIEIWSSCKGK
jgi:hypothetical protein